MNKPEICWEFYQVCDPCDVKNECSVGVIQKIDLDEPVYIEYSPYNNCKKYINACAYGAIKNNSS